MSAKKRTSLDSVFGAANAPSIDSAGESIGTLSVRTPVSQGERTGDRPNRPHVKQHTAYLPPEVHEQLRRLAFDEHRKIHDYLLEGLDRVFADRGLPSIRDLKGMP